MIKFGTDGWRGVIAKEFTFDNVKRVALAHALYLKEQGGSRVVVGYDLRFLSEEFAKTVASVFSSQGFEVVLSDSFCPTPADSRATRYGEFDHGIVITASHNYGKYNGYKIKESFGGAARTEVTKEIEKKLAEIESSPEL